MRKKTYNNGNIKSDCKTKINEIKFNDNMVNILLIIMRQRNVKTVHSPQQHGIKPLIILYPEPILSFLNEPLQHIQLRAENVLFFHTQKQKTL